MPSKTFDKPAQLWKTAKTAHPGLWVGVLLMSIAFVACSAFVLGFIREPLTQNFFKGVPITDLSTDDIDNLHKKEIALVTLSSIGIAVGSLGIILAAFLIFEHEER